MNLPETVCVSVQGPLSLLDLGGFHVCFLHRGHPQSTDLIDAAIQWGDDIVFDSTTGGLDADAGFKTSTNSIKAVVEEALINRCGYVPRELMFFGFGQGGMAALNTAGQYPYCTCALASKCFLILIDEYGR